MKFAQPSNITKARLTGLSQDKPLLAQRLTTRRGFGHDIFQSNKLITELKLYLCSNEEKLESA